MKRTQIILLSTLVIALIAYILLDNRSVIPELSGEYQIVGVSRTDNSTWEEFKTLGYWNHGDEHFTFSGDMSLKVSQELSNLIFDGHTDLNYHFLNKKLFLVAPDVKKTYTFNYKMNGNTLNLMWEHPYFKGMQLMPSDQLAKTTSQNLPKN